MPTAAIRDEMQPFTTHRVMVALAAAAALVAVHVTADQASGHEAAGAAGAIPVLPEDAVEAPTIARINAVRRQHGLPTVFPSRLLARSAEFHAGSMARQGYFSHTSKSGTSFDSRIERFYPSRRYTRWTVGENLLWWSPGIAPEHIVRLWLDSPSHRRVLLDGRWREIGLQAVHVRGAPGVFRGLEVMIVVANFGRRVR